MKKSFSLYICLLLLFSLFLTGCGAHPAAAEGGEPVTRTYDDLLGTVITLSIYQDTGQAIFDQIYKRVAEIDERMAENSTGSELAAVAEQAGKNPALVSEDTYRVIQKAIEISAASNNAFDVAIGPLVRLWNIGSGHESVPAQENINTALALIDYTQITLNDSDCTVFLQKEGMRIDLSGIAKGYAGDEARKIVLEGGVRHAILDLGGNIVTVGTRPDGTDWRIGIRSPLLGERCPIGALTVSDAAVVTSGGYERYFTENGTLYHHILDPQTGYPADAGLLSATIVCESSMMADMLSTSLFVLGLEQGLDLLKKYPAEAVLITSDRQVYVTPGLSNSFSLTDERFKLMELQP